MFTIILASQTEGAEKRADREFPARRQRGCRRFIGARGTTLEFLSVLREDTTVNRSTAAVLDSGGPATSPPPGAPL